MTSQPSYQRSRLKVGQKRQKVGKQLPTVVSVQLARCVCKIDVCLSRHYVLCRHCVINLILLLSIFLFVCCCFYFIILYFCCCQSPQQPSPLRPTVTLFYTVCLKEILLLIFTSSAIFFFFFDFPPSHLSRGSLVVPELFFSFLFPFSFPQFPLFFNFRRSTTVWSRLKRLVRQVQQTIQPIMLVVLRPKT